MRIQKTHAPSIARRRVTGQGMTEYIIIVGLIAIAAVGAVSFFGTAVKSQFVSLSSELVGEDGTAATATVKGAIGGETTKAGTKSTLGTYTANE